MSYSKDREEFVYQMTLEAGLHLSCQRKILKAAGVLQRGAEYECSVPMTAEEAGAHETRMGAARRMVANSLPAGWTAEVQGDPRGYVVRLYRPGENSDTAQGVAVPAQGYSSRQMERMTGRA